VLLIAGAIVLGILLGLVLGGSVRALARLRFLWWPLAFVALVLQLLPVPTMEGQVDHWLAVGLLIASYVALLPLVAVNIQVPGVPLLAVGFALNLLVISVNGGMPVRDEALREANGARYLESRQDLEQHGGAKHHLERPDDMLMPLADVIPIGAPVRQVFSVGDFVFMAGVAWVLAAGMKRGRSRGPAAMPEWPGDEEASPRPRPAGRSAHPLGEQAGSQ
jgi:hypothetical protein